MAATTKGATSSRSGSKKAPAKRAASKRAASKRAASKRYTPPDPAKRWRPRSRAGSVCGYTFRDKRCRKKGSHYCEPRADRVVRFFAEALVHTKGPWARRAFDLEDWQEHEIIRPLFGEVVWSAEWRCYVRRYTVAGIVLGRKNGKSELAAGIALYLLVGDDEESSEVYGAAKDTKQAGKVWEPAKRMGELSPLLARLKVNAHARRIYDEKTASYYEVITADAEGELGHNPHGFVLDEVVSQRQGSLWDAMVTAEGTRLQPLFLFITTETNDPSSFAADMIDEAERVEEDPARSPHTFAYVRKTPRTTEDLERVRRVHRGHPDLPVSLDVWDERNWRWANPALGQFLTIESLRKLASDAKVTPSKENGFRQYRLNQRVSQVTRWMPLHLWDGSAGMVDEDALAGRSCFAGLDLASTTDLASWTLVFFDEDDPAGDVEVLWRFWTPEAQIPVLDRATGGQATVWARQGFLSVTEGDWIDYWGDDANGGKSTNSIARVSDSLAIHPQIAADAERFRIICAGYDQKEATATAQHMQSIGLEVKPIYQGFALSAGLKELMRLVKAERFRHGGHPVARWCADSAEVKQNDEEGIKLVKPNRRKADKRVDGMSSAATAIRTSQLWAEDANAGEDFVIVAG